MLALTENAAAVIKEVVEASDLPGSAGLRIAVDPVEGDEDQGTLSLQLAGGAQEGDSTVEVSGARVFLGATAALLLDGKTLDATVMPDERVAFSIESRSS
jgi:iron-sulfur cluster assembly protein